MSTERGISMENSRGRAEEVERSRKQTSAETNEEVVIRPFHTSVQGSSDLRVRLLGTVGGGLFSARHKIAPEVNEIGRALMARRKLIKKRCDVQE